MPAPWATTASRSPDAAAKCSAIDASISGGVPASSSASASTPSMNSGSIHSCASESGVVPGEVVRGRRTQRAHRLAGGEHEPRATVPDDLVDHDSTSARHSAGAETVAPSASPTTPVPGRTSTGAGITTFMPRSLPNFTPKGSPGWLATAGTGGRTWNRPPGRSRFRATSARRAEAASMLRSRGYDAPWPAHQGGVLPKRGSQPFHGPSERRFPGADSGRRRQPGWYRRFRSMNPDGRRRYAVS